MDAVTAFGGGLVAVGYDDSGGDADGAVWVSTDGRRWERIADEAVFGGPDYQKVTDVAAFGGGLVAVGTDDSGGDADGAVWVSPAGGSLWCRLLWAAVDGGAV